MKIIAIEQELPGKSAKGFQPYLQAEALKVWELVQAGIIREIYFRDDEPSAVLILECEDANQAREVLNTLPLVQESLIRFEILPLKPYPGFERLFGELHKR